MSSCSCRNVLTKNGHQPITKMLRGGWEIEAHLTAKRLSGQQLQASLLLKNCHS